MIHEFLWLDLETTGLLRDEPGDLFGGGSILEVAAAAVNDSRDGDFEVVHTFRSPVYWHRKPGTIGDWPLATHTASGLLEECTTADDLDAVEVCLIEWARDIWGSDAKQLVLAGNSVHFDLAWIREQMPDFAQLLHHRVYDVSTLIRTADTYGIGAHPEAKRAHRATDDVLESIATVKYWRDEARAK